MLKEDFAAFVETQINEAAQGIATNKSVKRDDVGFGQLGFYLALRRWLLGQSSAEDIGLFDAMNDSLQALQLLKSGESFLARLKMTEPPGDSVIIVDDTSLQKWVVQDDAPMLVEFSQPGVNEFGEPDKSAKTGEIMDRLAKDYAGKVRFLRAPMAACAASAEKYAVTSVPAVLFLKNNQVAESVIDFHLVTWYRQKIESLWSIEPV